MKGLSLQISNEEGQEKGISPELLDVVRSVIYDT